MRTFEASEFTKEIIEVLEEAITGLYEYSANDKYNKKMIKFQKLLKRIQEEKLDVRLVSRE